LTFLHRQLHDHPRHLKGQLDPLRRFDRARKHADARLAAGGDDHRLDGANDLAARRRRGRAAGRHDH
jgi:hypothetical protein